MQGGSHRGRVMYALKLLDIPVTGIKELGTEKCSSVTWNLWNILVWNILVVCLSQAFTCNTEAGFLLCFSCLLTE